MILTFFPKICVKELEQEGKYWIFQFRLVSQCFASMYSIWILFSVKNGSNIFSVWSVLKKLFTSSGKNSGD